MDHPRNFFRNLLRRIRPLILQRPRIRHLRLHHPIHLGCWWLSIFHCKFFEQQRIQLCLRRPQPRYWIIRMWNRKLPRLKHLIQHQRLQIRRKNQNLQINPLHRSRRKQQSKIIDQKICLIQKLHLRLQSTLHLFERLHQRFSIRYRILQKRIHLLQHWRPLRIFILSLWRKTWRIMVRQHLEILVSYLRRNLNLSLLRSLISHDHQSTLH